MLKYHYKSKITLRVLGYKTVQSTHTHNNNYISHYMPMMTLCFAPYNFEWLSVTVLNQDIEKQLWTSYVR